MNKNLKTNGTLTEAETGGSPFWDALDRLAAEHRVVIDRPRGTPHPRFLSMIYPLDYGYLEGTGAVDGGGVDVWVGSAPERKLDAIALTVDLNKGDIELKLLLGTSETEKETILQFLNSGSMHAVLYRRGAAELDFLRSRRSVRRFLPRPVPREILERILETATWSPSAHNRQPWRFVVLTGRESRQRLADEMGAEFRRDLAADGLTEAEIDTQVERAQQRLMEAPAVVLLCLDTAVGDHYPDARRQQAELIMGIQGVAMAGQTLLLAAHACGLGGVWICAPLFAPDAVRRALDIPVEWSPQGLVFLGYPESIPAPRRRRDLSEIVRFDEA